MKKKSLSVLKKKVKDQKIYNHKSSRIYKIYKKFSQKTFKHVGKNKFVVAVSGGPDSLALAYFSKLYSGEFKNKSKCIIVDHKIRHNSSKEALEVKKLLAKKKITSKILTWKGKVPKSNIQSSARKIRYGLILKYCLKNNIHFVLTAHHQDDQIENFLIRLFRGSGIVGLSSMAENNEIKKNFKVIRPFLSLEKNDLKYISKTTFGTYIKDPSNKNSNFLRTRIRKYRKLFFSEGLDFKKVIKTINNLAIAKEAIDFYKYQAIKKHVKFIKKKQCVISNKLFKEEAKEIIFRTMSDIFQKLSSKSYPPRSKKIMNLLVSINKKTFKKSTLAGMIIRRSNNFIFISKEKNDQHVNIK